MALRTPKFPRYIYVMNNKLFVFYSTWMYGCMACAQIQWTSVSFVKGQYASSIILIDLFHNDVKRRKFVKTKFDWLKNEFHYFLANQTSCIILHSGAKELCCNNVIT